MSNVTWSLQHKRDTAANFTSNNPTLLAGQFGIETDGLTTTPKFKIGDGVTAWGTLPYATSGGLTIGTSSITGGTNTRILYNNNGVLGEYTLTGSGTVVAMATSPTFQTGITVNTSAVGTGAVIGNTFVGVWTDSAAYAVFKHNSVAQYALIHQSTGRVILNSTTGTNLILATGDNPVLTITDRIANFNPVALSGGALTTLTVTPPAHTNQTLSTNIPNFKVTGSTKQWATGALATQYFNYFSANTVSFVGASTATMPVNLYIDAPLAGTNCTATNLAALGIGGHCFIANSVGVPSNNPTGGGLLYVESGALKYRGSSGTVTTLGIA